MRDIKVLRTAFGILGNVFGVLLFMSPMITFKRIISKRSTEQFSSIPYVIALLNCLLSVWYSLPFVSPDNLLVTIVNSIGAGLEATYVLIFLIFAPKKEKAKICGYLFVVFSIVSCVALISLLAFHGNKRKLLCGFAFTTSCIMMYGSPLSVMRLVIKSKSVEYMPFFLSLAVFICSISWFIFALLGKDPFILVPNVIGTLLGAVQLILYGIYRDNRGVVKKDEMNESIETRTGELQDKKLAYNEDA
ncbi:bidirectional sugar transporter SWEET1-like [Solanum tuberosum]|uniref:Bidirectional sugar transporter SWEET n=2 Tax=Solanum tuberosum TaxID=4113 RepID=A0A142DVF7_SOLTU|nr:PREDICTED: bidirectional sugar transporter SWEET1-like [Solanum tuberosum]AMQ35575.1 SWEET transporter protein 1d [Solanum tuberosum]